MEKKAGNTHTQKPNQPIKHPDTPAGWRNSGTPQIRRAGHLGTTRLGQNRGPSAHSLTALTSSPRNCRSPGPLAAAGGRAPARERSPPAPVLPSAICRQPCRPASPGLPRNRTGTERREGPALSASRDGIGREAARVPPRACRETGLDGTPRGSHPCVGWSRLRRLAASDRVPPPPAPLAPVAFLAADPGTRAENQISDLQSLLQQLPAGCSGRLASVQRDVGGSAHARAQPCGWVRTQELSLRFTQTLRGLALGSLLQSLPAAPPPCKCKAPLHRPSKTRVLQRHFTVHPVCWQKNSSRTDPVWPCLLL